MPDLEPEPKLYYGSGSTQKFRLLVAMASAPQQWILKEDLGIRVETKFRMSDIADIFFSFWSPPTLNHCILDNSFKLDEKTLLFCIVLTSTALSAYPRAFQTFSWKCLLGPLKSYRTVFFKFFFEHMSVLFPYIREENELKNGTDTLGRNFLR